MSRDYLESRPYTGRILAEFLRHGTAESDARQAAERIAGTNATAAELGFALRAQGWAQHSFSAEIRASILDQFASEHESWAWFQALAPCREPLLVQDRIARSIKWAGQFREMQEDVREPLGWNDREFKGRKAA